VRHAGLRERRQVASLPCALTPAAQVTSRRLARRRFLKSWCTFIARVGLAYLSQKPSGATHSTRN